MTGSIIGPNYYIRLLTRRMGEISLNNVLHITTAFNTDDVGSFEIVLNYEDGWNEQNAFQNLEKNTTTGQVSLDTLLNRTTREMVLDIEPYDYVEIYLDRGETVNIIKTENNVATQIGYGDIAVDRYGQVLADEKGVPYGFGKFIYDENKKLTWIPFNYTIDNKGNVVKDVNNYTAIPLTIEERINNPYLICCGLVKSVTDSFSIQGGSPNNTITISGAGLGVYLQDSQLYYGGLFSVMGEIMAQIQSQILFSYSPSDAINIILTNLVRRNLDLLTTNDVYPDSIKKKYQDATFEPVSLNSEQLQKKSFLNQPIQTGATTNNTPNANTSSVTLYNTIPTIDLLFWAIEIDKEGVDTNYGSGGITAAMKNGKAYWGRLAKTQTGFSRSIVNPQPMATILDVLKQNSTMPFNEFFIDEMGNIVLRDYLKAINQGRPSTIDSDGNVIYLFKEFGYDTVIDPLTGNKATAYVWTDIESKDIINWTLTKSDASLKTIVLNQAVLALTGNNPALGQYTRAPILTDTLKELMKRIKEGTATQDEKEKAPIYEYFIRLANAQVQQSNGYNLTSLDDSGLKDFWRRYGFRVAQLIDVNSFLADEALINAQAAFLYFLFNMWGGTITIIGNPKIKIGTIVKIVDLNATFYVKGVSHNYTFGHEYTTSLLLTTGRIEGTINDPYQAFANEHAKAVTGVNAYTEKLAKEMKAPNQTIQGVTFDKNSIGLKILTPVDGDFVSVATNEVIWRGSIANADYKMTYRNLTVSSKIEAHSVSGKNFGENTEIGTVKSPGLFYKVEKWDGTQYQPVSVTGFVKSNYVKFLATTGETDFSTLTYTPNDDIKK